MILYLLFITLFIYIFIVYKRARKYKYNTSKDYLYNLDKDLISTIKLKKNKLKLANNHNNFDSLFLEISLSLNPLSFILKPFIQIENQKHYFEYGAKGKRYLNISNISHTNITLKLNYIKLSNIHVKLYGYKNDINDSKKILILAPHADDAEIAAFGLYKNTKDVTIVTTTAGENGVCNYCDLYDNDKTKQALKKGELRVLDALSVPSLGDVDITKCLTLGYFSGTLNWMHQNRDKKAISSIDNINNTNPFRKVSHSYINLPLHVEATQDAFLNDLKEIIKQTKPDIIITPHPAIDSHQDHKYTTYSLIEAMKELDFTTKLLLYTNHLELSETYPLGEKNSTITLPPNMKEFYFDSIYSYELDETIQIDKFFALEAIHDLRDSSLQISVKKAYKHLNKMIKRKITGKDKSYYKRAIRANELFFVVNSENIDNLII